MKSILLLVSVLSLLSLSACSHSAYINSSGAGIDGDLKLNVLKKIPKVGTYVPDRVHVSTSAEFIYETTANPIAQGQ